VSSLPLGSADFPKKTFPPVTRPFHLYVAHVFPHKFIATGPQMARDQVGRNTNELIHRYQAIHRRPRTPANKLRPKRFSRAQQCVPRE